MGAEAHDYLELWVIYEHPIDHPRGYVVRRQRALKRSGGVWIDPIGYAYDTLGDARAALPPGLLNIGRTDGDFASIKEVWV